MQASEFRIGNLVEHVSFGVVPLRSISETALLTEYKNNYYWDDLKFHKPILITEEWLLSIGYELMPSGTYLQPNSGNFIWFEKGLKCSIMGEYYPIEVKYVHQLQNLYFALNGIELKIKYNGE